MIIKHLKIFFLLLFTANFSCKTDKQIIKEAASIPANIINDGFYMGKTNMGSYFYPTIYFYTHKNIVTQ